MVSIGPEEISPRRRGVRQEKNFVDEYSDL